MDRISGADFIDIGGGRRGFQGQNAAAGVPGTELTDAFLNGVQEEIMAVIEKAGLKADSGDWSQLWQALNRLNMPGYRGRHFWQAVISIDVKAPPTDALPGDAYLIPVGATGNWQDKTGQIAIRDDNGWIYITPQNGHGICLPNGDVYVRVDGQYQPKIAQDVQSGKWQYAQAGGSSNTLIATLNPKPIAITAGLCIRLQLSANNTGPATLNVNGFGSKPLISHTGSPLAAGDLVAGSVIDAVYDGKSFRTIIPAAEYREKQWLRGNGYQVFPNGLIMQWGGYSGITNRSGEGGVWESWDIEVYWPITFPNAIFGIVGGSSGDVAGVGMQEQAWVTGQSTQGGTFLVACRQANATLAGRYIVMGY